MEIIVIFVKKLIHLTILVFYLIQKLNIVINIIKMVYVNNVSKNIFYNIILVKE